MCGRYAATRSAAALAETYAAAAPAAELPPSWNVAPTSEVYAVVERAGRDGGPVTRQIRTVRWGLVPSWAKDTSGAARLINARSETAAGKPSFRKALTSRRAIIPADGYFEWQKKPGGSKQPFYLHTSDSGGVSFAGLYELWRDDAVPGEDPAAWLWTATILTTESAGPLRDIHHRTPLTVPQGAWADWLNPAAEASPADLLAMLEPAANVMSARPVGPAVGNVRNNGAHLLDPA
ncbi:SOS response-associated peptidase [Longispora albida]|uniref:SOS response-associated peptidase n=1 Tax=Longispora albida TaxID=203523 RepID=UPI000377F881|nr:SOS response-associated peptidase [Longispora albida]